MLTATFAARNTACLLLAGPATMILGWTYLINDEKIPAAGAYIRTELAPRLTELADSPAFGWESAHRTGARRLSQKAGQLVVDLVAFCGPPTAAAVIC